MHPRIFQEFERICTERNASGSILEIGAIPSALSLLNMKSIENATEKVGINLNGPHRYNDFYIVRGNANSMTCFEDERFDTVLCNAMLEHDKFFWKTISEIRRVTKSGGLIVIGVPGFIEFPLERYMRFLARNFPIVKRFVERYFSILIDSTITYHIHNEPGDYYRYSSQVVRNVFFDNMKDIKISSIMLPPRLIGSGIKP